MKCERLRFFKGSMTRVWSTNPYENVILPRQIGRDVSLTFAPVLSDDQNIDQRLVATTVTTKMRRGAYYHVCFSTACRVNYNVGYASQFVNPPFGPVLQNLVVRREFFKAFNGLSTVTLAQNF